MRSFAQEKEVICMGEQIPPRSQHKKRGPFKGPTPPNVFQTVDFGTFRGEYLIKQITHNKGRNYVAVDPLFSIPKHRSEIVPRLKSHGITVSHSRMGVFIDTMISNNMRTRHVNIDMPFPPNNSLRTDHFLPEVAKLLANARDIIVPNGRIYLQTESFRWIRLFSRIARMNGLRVSVRSNMHPEDAKRRTGMTKIFAGME